MSIQLESALCSAFCGGLEVHPISTGYAVSTAFRDNSGDRISFYIEKSADGFDLVDGGDFLPDLIARDIHIEAGMRGDLLTAILAEGLAYWDRDTFEIRSDAIAERDLSQRSIGFLSALIRVRDLALITRERVKSAFREDFLREIGKRYGDQLEVEENVAPANDLAEFPADVVLRSKTGGRPGAVYLINSSDKLNEALLAWQELEHVDANVAMVAVIEDSQFHNISRKRFQRAQNRRLPMPIFRGDEAQTISFIVKEMKAEVA
ncbi:DUF1828 domain-containing protein [Novosphingobium sp. FGD1]|uniref:DUF1828 domain-containing protein n=1 Tax=Novosphingobium silvae TaxID=2692619 RepID=A0A7X4K6D3_9SPHN|nr:DUF1828 domain-containing protein [Novosphingobium silvae]MYL97059.1 DUF1828 domain-containing protein [Novosphingobium silvae]